MTFDPELSPVADHSTWPVSALQSEVMETTGRNTGSSKNDGNDVAKVGDTGASSAASATAAARTARFIRIDYSQKKRIPRIGYNFRHIKENGFRDRHGRTPSHDIINAPNA